MLQAQFSNMFWGLMQIWWLGFAEPLYEEAGAKAPASLNILLDKVSDLGIAPPCGGNTGPVLDLVFRTFRTDIFCIEDVDDAPVYH